MQNEYEESLMELGLQKIIWDNIKHCNKCSGCAPGREMVISGSEFKNICRGWPIQFVNPNASTLEYVKELIEYRENLISTNTLPPPFFWTRKGCLSMLWYAVEKHGQGAKR